MVIEVNLLFAPFTLKCGDKTVGTASPLGFFMCLYQYNLYWYHQDPYIPSGAKLYRQKPKGTHTVYMIIALQIKIIIYFALPKYTVLSWNCRSVNLTCGNIETKDFVNFESNYPFQLMNGFMFIARNPRTWYCFQMYVTREPSKPGLLGRTGSMSRLAMTCIPRSPCY